MYKVIKNFVDLQTGHTYKVGDSFPKDGVKVSDSRIAKLASSSNRQKTPLIEKVMANGLNSAIPAQPEMVEQGTPQKEDVVETTETIESSESPRRNQNNRKSNKKKD